MQADAEIIITTGKPLKALGRSTGSPRAISKGLHGQFVGHDRAPPRRHLERFRGEMKNLLTGTGKQVAFQRYCTSGPRIEQSGLKERTGTDQATFDVGRLDGYLCCGGPWPTTCDKQAYQGNPYGGMEFFYQIKVVKSVQL